MSGDIVDAIDHTLHDYSTSLDAMRWTPDVPEDEPDVLDETHEFRAVVATLAVRAGLADLSRWAAAGAEYARSIENIQRAIASEGTSRMGADIVGLIQPDEITDPRARALAARQTRNVGPDGRIPAGRKRRT